jgi:hypothetical protein
MGMTMICHCSISELQSSTWLLWSGGFEGKAVEIVGYTGNFLQLSWL